MFHIIGVAHRVQSKQKGADDSADQKQFCECLEGAIKRLKPVLVAEEFSTHALAKLRAQMGVEHESVTKAVADRLEIDHRYCDPDAEERAKLGYREGTEIALQLAMGNADGLSNAEINDRGFAIEVAKYWPIREKFWARSLDDVKDKEVIFVCGDAHVETFQALLRKNGIDSATICRHIGVTTNDDEFWNRVTHYLNAHPELRDAAPDACGARRTVNPNPQNAP